MRRVVRLPALVLALWALGLAVAAAPQDDGDTEIYIKVHEDEPDGGDAGADGGTDGGWNADGGSADAGVVDAGHDFVERWFWIQDGGHYPSGATDRVEVRVGRWVEAQFYRPAVLTVCDAPIVNVRPFGESVRFFALDAGSTQCGFWLGAQQPFPDRLVDVVVYPRDW